MTDFGQLLFGCEFLHHIGYTWSLGVPNEGVNSVGRCPSCLRSSSLLCDLAGLILPWSNLKIGAGKPYNALFPVTHRLAQ